MTIEVYDKKTKSYKERKSQNGDEVVVEGENFRIKCEYDGNPPPSINITKTEDDVQMVLDKGRSNIVTTGQQSAQENTSITYQCVGNNNDDKSHTLGKNITVKKTVKSECK